jgi:hypothetical protein
VVAALVTAQDKRDVAATDVITEAEVRTPEGQCARYETLDKVDRLEWQLRQLDGVGSTNTLALLNRRVLTGLNEGSPKWYELIANQDMLNSVTAGAPRGLYNDSCSLLTLYVYLRDHKAETLTRAVDHIEAFARENNTSDGKERDINARFQAMVSHFLFEAEFCNPAPGWEKARSRRNVRDARHRLWQPTPAFASLQALNEVHVGLPPARKAFGYSRSCEGQEIGIQLLR